MFAMRPNPYLGFQQPMQQPPQAIQQPQVPPQMQGQVLQQPGLPMGMQGQPQLNPQLLAQLAQLHGFGLGGFRPQQPQLPMFGRPSIQPIQSGAYSLR